MKTPEPSVAGWVFAKRQIANNYGYFGVTFTMVPPEASAK
jgi:hypothetical protein